MPLSLTQLLVDPALALRTPEGDWNGIFDHARRSETLGQLAERLALDSQTGLLPERIVRHLRLARLTEQRRGEAALWEIGIIRRAIPEDIPVILLKGCAYLAAGDENSRGRHFSDIDILVPKPHLAVAESSLVAAGWLPGPTDEYDQHYYREWTHEVPPMEHVRRNTVIDLHHAIVPVVSRYRVATQRLLEASIEVLPGVRVLAPVDRIVHCAVHALIEGDPRKAFRDLLDLHLLQTQHCPARDFRQVMARAGELGLERMVGTALAAADELFGGGSSHARGGVLTQALVSSAAIHDRQTNRNGNAGLAGLLIVAHSHWAKFPIRILVPHLLRKAYMGIFAKDEEAEGAT